MTTKWIPILFLCVSLLTACTEPAHLQATPAVNMNDLANVEEIDNEQTEPPAPIEIQLTAVGDVMVHGPQLKAQYNKISGKFDFHNNFHFIKPYVENADLALFNLETTFAGEEKGYSSYPRFNSPDSLAEALRTAGFDVAVTANNHTIDTGMDGVLRTLDVLHENDLKTVGTRKSDGTNRFLVEDVKGIKIGITAYTYETPSYGKNRTINALILPSGLAPLINTFRYDRMEEDLIQMKATIADMRAAGAEFIVFYLHWGEEFQRQPNPYQQQLAQSLNASGVDIILGSHPHVLQPMEWITHPEHGHRTFVVYSLGNFLSNQRYEILKNRYTEDGMLVHIKIMKDLVNNTVHISDVSYQSTWVHKYALDGKRVFEILPLPEAFEKPEEFHLISAESRWRAKLSYDNSGNLLLQETTTKFASTNLKRKIHIGNIE
jgi:poly-gamma-glutamate synthesis protein (capsule biosynthesis protein)